MNAIRKNLRATPLRLLVGMVLMASPATAQPEGVTPEGSFSFLPGPPLMLPLIAPDAEPRVGIRKEIGSSMMTLDIGATYDLAEYSPSTGTAFRLGVDVFAYALTLSFEGHRLQVDAVDGFFGGHILYRAADFHTSFVLRVRGLHRSAHFLDGHFDNSLNQWKGGRSPLPFTKDFADILLDYTLNKFSVPLTVYSSLSYTTLVRPVDIGRFAMSFGTEISSGTTLGSVFGRPFAVFAACNVSLDWVPEQVATSVMVAGVKFGQWQGQGLRLVFGYRSGLEMYGEYFDVRRDYWSLGVLFDVW
jgi:hypothetical protein